MGAIWLHSDFAFPRLLLQERRLEDEGKIARKAGYCLILWLLLIAQLSLAQGLPIVTPEQAGFDSKTLVSLEIVIDTAIQAEKMPGCVVCFGRRSYIAWLKAYGRRQIEPTLEPMTTDTIFDLASLTKPVATATSIMKLVELEQLQLSDKVALYFPEFGVHGKEAISVQQLLLHQSGLIPDNPLADYQNGPEVAWQKICDLQLNYPVGSSFRYSDVNFIVLGKLVENLSKKSLDTFSRERLFAPLGMTRTTFLPEAALHPRIAPTEKRDGHWIRGQVHDPRAFALGGIAGHAGLFSTAEDLAVYANMMLGHPAIVARLLNDSTRQRMTTAHDVTKGLRALGWDKQTSYSSNRGTKLSSSAFGHGGFTGTVLWIDPEKDFYFIFLSNRLHPNGKGSINQLAGELIDIIVTSIK